MKFSNLKYVLLLSMGLAIPATSTALATHAAPKPPSRDAEDKAKEMAKKLALAAAQQGVKNVLDKSGVDDLAKDTLGIFFEGFLGEQDKGITLDDIKGAVREELDAFSEGQLKTNIAKFYEYYGNNIGIRGIKIRPKKRAEKIEIYRTVQNMAAAVTVEIESRLNGTTPVPENKKMHQFDQLFPAWMALRGVQLGAATKYNRFTAKKNKVKATIRAIKYDHAELVKDALTLITYNFYEDGFQKKNIKKFVFGRGKGKAEAKRKDGAHHCAYTIGQNVLVGYRFASLTSKQGVKAFKTTPKNAFIYSGGRKEKPRKVDFSYAVNDSLREIEKNDRSAEWGNKMRGVIKTKCSPVASYEFMIVNPTSSKKSRYQIYTGYPHLSRAQRARTEAFLMFDRYRGIRQMVSEAYKVGGAGLLKLHIKSTGKTGDTITLKVDPRILAGKRVAKTNTSEYLLK